MSPSYASPQDAEDAFYDAIEAGDLAALRQVWEDSPDIACLLPMQPLLLGEQVHEAWQPLREADFSLEITVQHIRWVTSAGGGDLAIHYLMEQVLMPGHPPQPPLFATNIFRKGPEGWRMILHQNSPAPPPPEMQPPR